MNLHAQRAQETHIDITSESNLEHFLKECPTPINLYHLIVKKQIKKKDFNSDAYTL